MNMIPLTAGLWRVRFDRQTGNLRRVSYGEVEILRAITASVRDCDWQSVPPVLDSIRMKESSDGLEIDFDAQCRKEEIDFKWHGRILIAGGTLEYSFRGEAISRFRKNRIGLCVLHPADCAGRPCVIEHTHGGYSNLAFPKAISPYQPVGDIRAITHFPSVASQVDVRMEGDVFEMEDQRNWTDASFKTYCTPLSRPFPVEISVGRQIEQRVIVTVFFAKSAPHKVVKKPVEWRVDVETRRPLPQIGLQARNQETPDLTPEEITHLRELKLSHLRVELPLANSDVYHRFCEASADAERIGAGLEIALIVEADQELKEFAAWLRDHPSLVPIKRCAILPGNGPATPPALLETGLHTLRSHLSCPLGAGTRANFAELNRNRMGLAAADFVTFGINPQVHAVDELSLMETLSVQANCVRDALTFCEAHKVVVAPLTLKPPFNAVATGNKKANSPDRLQETVDARQRLPFCAAWTWGSLKYLTEAGASAVTCYEPTGWLGVMETAQGGHLPIEFPSSPGELFPVYEVFKIWASFTGGYLVPVQSSDPLSVVGLQLVSGARRAFVAISLDDAPRTVRVLQTDRYLPLEPFSWAVIQWEE